jgi:amino acid transporter
MNIEDKGGTSIQHRTAEYKPKKSWRNWFIGRPLQTADAPHQTIGKLVGLAVFSSDALSSVAYSPQEVLLVLAMAGPAAFTMALPLAFAVIILLVILTISYEQTIHAYPGGGGAYIVARDNLGELPAQTAGAALLTDYILTVAVSISSGVAQLVSAYPVLYDYRVWIAVGMVILVTVINLRGVKESGVTFAIPTYFFLIMMFITIGVGLFRFITGTLGTVPTPPVLEIQQTYQVVTLFLILKAFASGTTALTGVEAISNGITAFKEPKSRNAGITLVWMSIILGSSLLGIVFLGHFIGAVPSESETVISQLSRTVFQNRGILYLATISSTTIILMMAANTAFADFPRLGALHAGDGFLPRQLTYRGSRLVYSRGIITLAAIASLLIIIFQASVSKLIPLYAIGVFLSFTLSQSGMAVRWWKCGHLKPGVEVQEPGSVLRYEKGWLFKMIVNGFGAISTLIVMGVFAITKFKDGAYIVVILTPVLVTIFFSIHHHYKRVAKSLSLEKYGEPAGISHQTVIMPIGGVHRGTLQALKFARTLTDDITAIHISVDPAEAERIQSKWEMWGNGIRLVVLDSPYRLFLEPLLEYIDSIDAKRHPNEIITIVVPEFVDNELSNLLLHMNTAAALRRVLLNRPNIVIIEVPYKVENQPTSV